jgi:hypothetical protein
MTVTCPADLTHQIAHHDLPARRRRAQPRRLDHRLAEMVAPLHRRVAQAHTDPHPQLLPGPPVARLDSLLHRHAAPQRLRRACEHHHQPIAEILDLTTPGLLQRSPQQPKVLRAQALRGRGTDPVGRRRRPNQIGHQHRHRLCSGGAHRSIIRPSDGCRNPAQLPQAVLLMVRSRAWRPCPRDRRAR